MVDPSKRIDVHAVGVIGGTGVVQAFSFPYREDWGDHDWDKELPQGWIRASPPFLICDHSASPGPIVDRRPWANRLTAT